MGSVNFNEDCSKVKEQILGRVKGANGWKDPHNGGHYSERKCTKKSDGGLCLQRKTGGKGLYTDHFDLTFTKAGTGCSVYLCSESQVTSLKDFSTNYCNLYNLYSNNNLLTVTKTGIKHCDEHDPSKCGGSK